MKGWPYDQVRVKVKGNLPLAGHSSLQYHGADHDPTSTLKLDMHNAFLISLYVVGLWDLCSKFPALFYSEFLSNLFIMLNFILFMLLLLSLFPIFYFLCCSYYY